MGTEERGPSTRQVSLAQAAADLGLPPGALEALVHAGYLPAATTGGGEMRLAPSDLKAFVARNQPDSGASLPAAAPGASASSALELPDLAALRAALGERAEHMAHRALGIFTAAVHEAAAWDERRRARFVDQARRRFEAILAIVGAGDGVGSDLLAELTGVGRAAARAGDPLPEVLLTLRISRDLVVQTAVEIAEDSVGRPGFALSLMLTQVLPGMDRLTDAIASGYWSAVVDAGEEQSERYATVVEHAADGVVEMDASGAVRYANPALGVILGVPSHHLLGRPLEDALLPAGPSEPLARALDPSTPDWGEVTVRRADGAERVLLIRAHRRRGREGAAVVACVVRDVTADRRLSRQKADFLAFMARELRGPLATVLGLGVTLDAYAAELPVDRVRHIGRSIHRHAERLARLADDLLDVSRLETSTLILSPRTIEVRAAVQAALGMLGAAQGPSGVEVRVPPGLFAWADARRTEQVVAHLVENALVHGAPPVVVEALDCDTEVELCVSDRGPGLPPGEQDVVFGQPRPTDDASRYRDRATKLGLSLVRGLVEAMGGRAWYEPVQGGGVAFLATLPTGPRPPRGE